jgi:hypothetical protein
VLDDTVVVIVELHPYYPHCCYYCRAAACTGNIAKLASFQCLNSQQQPAQHETDEDNNNSSSTVVQSTVTALSAAAGDDVWGLGCSAYKFATGIDIAHCSRYRYALYTITGLILQLVTFYKRFIVMLTRCLIKTMYTCC